MSEREVVLRVENLCQYFPMGGGAVVKAVDGVSFDIKKGEVFGLVGESGCGKTTTGRTIIGLYEATSGSVYLKGRRIGIGKSTYKDEVSAVQDEIYVAKVKTADELKALAGSPEYERVKAEKNVALADFIAFKNRQIAGIKTGKRYDRDYMTKIQMIFQDPVSSLNPRMTVRDLISEGLVIQGMRDKKEIDRRVYEVMDLVGLMPEHANRYQHEFSGGQRQRIGIARAIILNPDLLIADEPVSALDVSIQAQVITLLNELRQKIGLTILFIAHNLSVVKYFSDRIAVMYYGKIVELASTSELFARPMHRYTRALLSAVPYPDPLHERQRKRILYNPIADHDYAVHKPELVEIVPGHFIYCNRPEYEGFCAEFKL